MLLCSQDTNISLTKLLIFDQIPPFSPLHRSPGRSKNHIIHSPQQYLLSTFLHGAYLLKAWQTANKHILQHQVITRLIILHRPFTALWIKSKLSMAFQGPIHFSKLISSCSPVTLCSTPPPPGSWASCSLCLLILALPDLSHPSDLRVNITSCWYYSVKWIYPSFISLAQKKKKICAKHCAGIKCYMISWSLQSCGEEQWLVNKTHEQVPWRGWGPALHKMVKRPFWGGYIETEGQERINWENGLLPSITHVPPFKVCFERLKVFTVGLCLS